MAETRVIPAPVVDPETQPFWDAAAQGKLMIKHCRVCGELHYPPRALCPFCFSEETEFQQAAGLGEIYTFSVMRRAPGGPFAIGYVTLDEGPSILTNFIDCDFDALSIGQRVKVAFHPTDGGPPVPMFTPAD